MRRLFGFLFIACAMQLPLLAQSSTQFTINFPLFPGTGFSGEAELSDSSFTAQVFLGALVPDYGRILEIAESGSTAQMFQFSTLQTGTYPPSPVFPGSGGGTYYYFSETWNLTPPNVQNLLAGHWFVEIAFGTDTFSHQITPVPEPTSVALFILGATVARICYRRRLQRCEAYR